MNRLVPNEGPLMDRIDFFGAAVFIPIFLVTVGMLLGPRVMFEAETLKLAALFIIASIGGKTLAAGVARAGLGFSTSEAELMLGLTIPQAAATLAATVIGFNIGLFDQTVVNAVLVLILASIVTATLIVDRAKKRVPPAAASSHTIGKRVLVALDDPVLARLGFAIGAHLAAPDSGVVRGLLACSPDDARAAKAGLAQLRAAGFTVGLDTDPALLVDPSFVDGVINVVAAQEPSFVLIGQRRASTGPAFGTSGEAVAASITAPVAIVIGDATAIGEVVLFATEHAPDDERHGASAGFAAELATRIAGNAVAFPDGTDSPPASDLAPGQLGIAQAASWDVLAALDPPAGSALLLVLEPPPTAAVNGRDGVEPSTPP